MTPTERLLTKVVVGPATGCWLWTGATTGPRRNYSAFYLNGRQTSGHRASYEIFVGPIPKGLAIDHLCRNTLCVKPEHLEPVTTAENNARQGAAVTHCPQGHLYDDENTYRHPRTGNRDCRRCRTAAVARVRERQRSAA